MMVRPPRQHDPARAESGGDNAPRSYKATALRKPDPVQIPTLAIAQILARVPSQKPQVGGAARPAVSPFPPPAKVAVLHARASPATVGLEAVRPDLSPLLPESNVLFFSPTHSRTPQMSRTCLVALTATALSLLAASAESANATIPGTVPAGCPGKAAADARPALVPMPRCQ